MEFWYYYSQMFERRPLFIRVLMYVGESGSIRKDFFFF
jgi:hypothetical protein